MKNRFTSYNFWISMVSAVLLICQALNLKFDIIYINEIATAVLGLLVVIGIVSDPTKGVKSAPEVKDQPDEKKEDIPCETTGENLDDIIQNDIKNTLSEMKMESEKMKKETESIFSDFLNLIVGKFSKNEKADEEFKEDKNEELTTKQEEILENVEEVETVLEDEKKEEDLQVELAEILEETDDSIEKIEEIEMIAEETVKEKEDDSLLEIVETKEEETVIETKTEDVCFKIVND